MKVKNAVANLGGLCMLSKKHQDRMFGIAHSIKLWSACPNGRQHACVLAWKGKYIRSTGYNGLKHTCRHLKACPQLSSAIMRTVCGATHAEVNACHNLPQLQENVVAFVTKKPCIICMHELKQHGIHEVYWQEWFKGHIVDKGYKKL